MPIKMTPTIYYEAFLLGNYYDFLEDTSNIRKVFNVTVSASQLADCYYNYYKKHRPDMMDKYKTFTSFINYISQNTNNYFQDIRSIANAYKHLYTGISEKYSRHSTITSAGTIETIVFKGEIINHITEELTNNYSPKLTVVYTRKTGEQIIFLKSIKKVVKFWDKMVYSK